MFKKLIVVLLLSGITAPLGHAEGVTFWSTNLIKDEKPILLSGILTKPNGEGPFPAVVLLHGCSGLEQGKKRSESWSDRLVDWGYVTLQLDSFGPRGIKDDCKGPSSTVMQRARARDAYDAKSFLSKLFYIDRNRIGVMGWSHGGKTVLTLIESTSGDDNPFTVAVAFYPWCSFLVQPNAPLMILIGESDDWTPAWRCSKALPSMPTEHEIILKIYPGAYHDFDWEGIDKSYLGHRLKYDPTAAEDATVTVRNFLARYLKR